MKLSFVALATTAVLLVFSTVSVEATPTIAKKLPNGNFVLKKLGHKKNGGPTKFAKMFSANGFKWSEELCKKPFPSKKHKGLTVGEYLGDPCCKWSGEGDAPFKVEKFPSKDKCKTLRSLRHE